MFKCSTTRVLSVHHLHGKMGMTPAELKRSADPPFPSERLRTKDIHQSMKNPRRRLYNFHVRRRDERNSFLLDPLLLFLKGLSRPAHLLSSSLFTITRSFLFFYIIYLILPTYSIRFFVCRFPPSPTLPSLRSCPLHRLHRSPLTTICGLLRIVPRTSLVFTHTLAPTPPYTEIGLWYACHVFAALFTPNNPNQTAVDYHFPEPRRGPVRGLASIPAVRKPAVVLVFVFFLIIERLALAPDIPRRQW